MTGTSSDDAERERPVQSDPVIDQAAMEGVTELRAVTVRKEQGILADEIKLGDQVGNWQTEAFHESIKQRLKTLGKMIENRGSQQTHRRLISDQFVCSDLRPDASRLEKVFSDEHLTVVRPSSPIQTDSLHAGFTGLAEAVDQLTSPFGTSGCVIL